MLYTNKMLEIIDNKVEISNYRGESEQLDISKKSTIKGVIQEKFSKTISISNDLEIELDKEDKNLYLILDLYEGRALNKNGELFIDANESKRVSTILKRNFKSHSIDCNWSVNILKIADTKNRKPIILKMIMTNGMEKIGIVRGHYINIININHLDNYLKKFNISDIDINNIVFKQI